MKFLNWAKILQISVASACCALASSALGQAKITIDAGQPGHKVSPTLWGVFFEDINHSADGGVYPELVRNRSFEDADKPDSWIVGSGEAAIESDRPLNPLNPHSLRLRVPGAASLKNKGYWGMSFVKGEKYVFSVAARAAEGVRSPIEVVLEDESGQPLASASTSRIGGQWHYFDLELTPKESAAKGQLELKFSGNGTVWLDMVSLMPAKTWKDHGLRPDLCETLDALKPSFVRFPGGCWVEGDDMAHMYHWKYTIGDVAERKPLYNIWDYWATHGLGYHEYLQMTEDLGATPLFCINVGMSHHQTVPMDQMGQWVQDALDAIEYANGPTNSVWGALRAKAGHPASFNLRYMEIGNENGGADYRQRWPLYYNAIHAKYPEIKFVANVWGGYPTNPMPDIIDEHYYDTPEFFMHQANRYDSYDRKGPKIFVGEYAVTKNCGLGNLRGAVGEAAFMTGMERNSDVVVMASYAPLLVNVNHRKWNPDLINFDSSRIYGLPSYYVQQMFSQNRGDVVLPTTAESPAADVSILAGSVGIGNWKTRAEFKDLKVTGPDGKVLYASDFAHGTNGWKFFSGEWQLDGDTLRQNSLDENIRATVGDASWKDYTFTLKARKLEGYEGFLVMFRAGAEGNWRGWNLGGWGNSKHAIQMDDIITEAPGSIEEGRWYDIRVEAKGNHFKCYLEGKLVHDTELKPMQSLFASTTHDSKSGDIIMKVVNVASGAVDTDVHLQGAKNLTGKGEAIVLTSASPVDENSLEEPTKVSPKTESINVSGSQIHRSFPGNSVTVLRIGTKTH